MARKPIHPWNLTPQEAIALQRRLRGVVILTDQLSRVHRVAGVDASYDESKHLTTAAVAVLTLPDLQVVATSISQKPMCFPYLPGLLSFREAPAILEALQGIEPPPDLLLCDGHGLAHPRRFGLACHLGVLTGIPSIGVAKRLLVGSHEQVPNTRGAWRAVIDHGEIVGAALRTRLNVKPVYVSPGHMVGLETAREYVMRCTTNTRLPEPVRAAHHLASS